MTEDKICTKEAQKKTGLTCQTLQDYARRGLITPPILRSYGVGGGRGTCYWWSKNIDFQVAIIRSYINMGFSKDKIVDQLNGNIDYVKLHRKNKRRNKNARKT